MEFNLITENWIPVLYANGQWHRVGIRKALEDAHHIRQIAASNPMDNVALLRFLLAILYWCQGDQPDNVPQDQFPPEWFQKLNDHKDYFNLLGNGKRFYQHESMKNKEARPIADLLVEFPGADSVNHMRHVIHDGSYGFCPACCALGILRLSVWAPANAFYPASVNPGSAAYAIVQEGSLFLMLKRQLTETVSQSDGIPWLSHDEPKSSGIIAKLAWRPRKMWLKDSNEQGCCANCGCESVLIKGLCNEGGWKTPSAGGKQARVKKFWDSDPHLLKDDEPISLPLLDKDVALHSSRFWRDSLRLRPKGVSKVTAIGPVVNKFTFQDTVSIELPNVSATTRADLSGECSRELPGLLKWATQNPSRQHPEIRAAVVTLTPDVESRIRAALDNPTNGTDDKEFLHDIYEPMVESVVVSTTVGSPLRRREALFKGKAALNRLIEQAIQNQAQANAADAPASTGKKKRSSRKSRQETDS